MRKHLSIPVVLVMFLALFSGLTARAQVGTFLGYSNAVYNAVPGAPPYGFWPLQETGITVPSSPATAANDPNVILGGINATYIGGAFPGQPGAFPGEPSATSTGFDASTGEVLFPGISGQPVYYSSSSFSTECWLNCAASNSTTEYFLGFGNFGTPSASPQPGYSGFRMRVVNSYVTVLLYNTNGTTSSINLPVPSATPTLPAGFSLVPGTWNHVAVTYNGTGTGGNGTSGGALTIYINGVQATNNTAALVANPTSGAFYVPADISDSGTITIGCSPNQTSYFQGYIQDVVYYPGVLPASDILAHYQNGISATPSPSYKTLIEAEGTANAGTYGLSDTTVPASIYLRLTDAAIPYPVAVNAGSTGAAGNGYYLTGTTPSVTGPTNILGAQTLATSFAGPHAVTAGPSVDCAPLNGNLFNNNSNVAPTLPNNVYPPSTNQTVLAWVKVPAGSVTWTQGIVGRNASSFRMRLVQSGTIGEPDFRDGSIDALSTTNSMADGNWHFWAGVYNATNHTSSNYIDNVLVATSASGTAPSFSVVDPFCIGNDPSTAADNFTGSICGVAIYTNALTPAQIQSVYSAASGFVAQPTPTSALYVAGTTNAISFSATFANAASYQWYSGSYGPGNNTAVGTGITNEISGATTSTLTFTPGLPTAEITNYFLVVKDGNNNFQTSSIVSLNVLSVNGAFDQAVLALTPLAYYPLNETSGTTIYNYSPILGAALNGVVQTGISQAPNDQGLPGPAVDGFGGSDLAIGMGTSDGINYVQTANNTGGPSGTGILITNTALDYFGSVSVACWVQLPKGFNNGGNQEYVYGQANDSALIDFGNSGGSAPVMYFSAGGTSHTGGPNLADGKWHFWTATFNASTLVGVCYLDGATNFSASYHAETATASATDIGSSTSDTRNLSGNVCRLAVFTNVVLTAQQVSNLYNAAGIPPGIVVNPPASVIANAGSSVTLGTVAASGSTPISYQWYSGSPNPGVNTPLVTGARYPGGVTSTNLVISPVLSSDAGSYFAVAMNTYGSATSTVTVLSVPTTASETIFAGQIPTFSLASGGGPYVWTTNGVIDTTQTGSTYKLTTTSGQSPVTVVGSNNGTPGVSTTVTVVAAPTDPYVAAVLANNPVSYFRLDAASVGTPISTGSTAFDYVGGNNGVYHNDGTPADLEGATGFPYNPPVAGSGPVNSDPGVAFGVLGTSNSQLTVGGALGPSNNFAGFIPNIDFSRAVSNSTAYVPAEFSVEAWVYATAGQFNGGIVTKGFGFGGQGASPGLFEQFSLQPGDTGTSGSRLEFDVRDATGVRSTAQTGSGAVSSLHEFGVPTWLHLVGVCDQSNGLITLYVNGLSAVTASISKVNGIMSTLVPVSIGAKQAEDATGNYDGQFNGTVDEVAIYTNALTSNQVQSHYFATGIAPSILTQPKASTSANGGTTVALNVVAFGTPPLFYQWYDSNGVSVGVPGVFTVPGVVSNLSTLTLPNVHSDPTEGSDIGNPPATGYGSSQLYVVITNTYGSITSSLATLLVQSGPPVLTAQLPSTVYAVQGTTVSLSVSGESGTSPFTNAWYSNVTQIVNGGRVGGATNVTLTITNVQATDAGTYTFYTTNSFPPAVSSSTILVVLSASGNYDNAVLGLNPLGYWLLNEPTAFGTNAYNYATNGIGSALNGAYQTEYDTVAVPCPLLQGVAGPPVAGFGGVPGNLATAFSTADGITYVGTMNVSGGHAGTGVLITNSILESNNNFTVAAWIQIPQGLNVGNQGYVYGQPDGSGIGFGVNGGAGTQEALNVAGGGGGMFGGGPALNDGRWHFIVAAFNNTNKMSTNYLDGAVNFVSANSTPTGSTTVTGIGSSVNDTRNFNGQICRLAVFTNTLTAAQVASLYAASQPLPVITLNPPATVSSTADAAVTLGPVLASDGGTAPITYHWYSGTPAGPNAALSANARYTLGVTSTNLVIDPVGAGDAGSYFVVANNGSATATSTVTVLTVATTAADTIIAGASPTFALPILAGATYQWTSNGVVVATTRTFTLTGTSTAHTPVLVQGSINGVGGVVTTVNVVATPTDLYPLTVLADHPIAYFRLDEASPGTPISTGTTAYDYVGGNNGTYVNDGINSGDLQGATGFPYNQPLMGTAPVNPDSAVSFGTVGDGNAGVAGNPPGPSNNFVGAIPIDLSVPQGGNGEFSVEAWVYGEAGQHNGGIVTKGFGFGDGNTAQGFFEQFSLQNSDVGTSGSRFDFIVRDALGNASSAETGAGTINETMPTWTHVVGVCDQALGVVSIYTNGVLNATAAITPGNGIMATAVPMSIGAKQQENGSGTNYDGQWQGYVDEVAVYNYALTAAQVANHYSAVGVAPTILVQPTNASGMVTGQTNANVGSTLTLTGGALGTPTLYYQWYDYNGGAPIALNIAGVTTTNPTLILNNLSAAQIGSGTLVLGVTNAYGSAFTGPVVIALQSGSPVISPDLPSQTYALVGGNAVFTVGLTGTAPFANQWLSNSVPLANGSRVSGAVSTTSNYSTLIISNVQAGDAATYSMVATGVGNSTGGSGGSTLVIDNEPLFNGNGGGWTLNNTPDIQPSGPILPSINNNVLQLTTDTENIGGDAESGQAASFFYNTPMYVGGFTTSFKYHAAQDNADGVCFVIQNSPAGPSALGGGGGALAVTGIQPSVEFEIDLYTENYAWDTNGLTDQSGGSAEFNGGIPTGESGTIDVTLTYIGTTLTIALHGEGNSVSFTQTRTVGSIPALVGGNTAYIGFTGACGGLDADQTVSSFTYSPLLPLTVTASGGNVVFTWPTSVGGFVLQSTPTLPAVQGSGPGTWTTVSPGPAGYPIVGGNYQVTLPTSGGTTFYQLYHP